MSANQSSLILIAALAGLLRDALEADLTAHLADSPLKHDLRELSARVELELAALEQRQHLRLAR